MSDQLLQVIGLSTVVIVGILVVLGAIFVLLSAFAFCRRDREFICGEHKPTLDQANHDMRRYVSHCNERIDILTEKLAAITPKPRGKK